MSEWKLLWINSLVVKGGKAACYGLPIIYKPQHFNCLKIFAVNSICTSMMGNGSASISRTWDTMQVTLPTHVPQAMLTSNRLCSHRSTSHGEKKVLHGTVGWNEDDATMECCHLEELLDSLYSTVHGEMRLCHVLGDMDPRCHRWSWSAVRLVRRRHYASRNKLGVGSLCGSAMGRAQSRNG